MGSFRELFSVERVLSARGLKSSMSEPTLTFLNSLFAHHHQNYAEFYDWFRISENRFKLLTHIDSTSRNHDSDLPPSRPYSADMMRTAFPELSYCTFDESEQICRQRFSGTLEWLLGEILVCEFHAWSSATGIEICSLSDADEARALGDFDVVSVMSDMSLLYIECKSGGTTVDEIRKAIRRSRLLGASATILALERKTGQYDILHKLLSTEQHPLHGLCTTVYRLSSFGLPSSEIFGWGSVVFVPVAAKSLENCVRTAIRFNSKLRLNFITYEANFTGKFGPEIKNLFNSDGFHIDWDPSKLS